MTGNQENILRELLEKFFSGGNTSQTEDSVTLKKKLEAIRDFVVENFSE